jgi:hypothetical protein
MIPPKAIQLDEHQTYFRVPVCFVVVDTLTNEVLSTMVWQTGHRTALRGAVAFAKGMNDPGEKRYKVFRASAQITIGDEVQFSDDMG